MRLSLRLPAGATGVLAALAATTALAAPAALAASSPTVKTGAVTADAQSSADLHGTINPNGAGTGYFFQFGATTAFGSVTATRSLAAGTKTVPVSDTASGLVPGTTYYYRLVASNGSGESFGATRSFRTMGNPPPGATTGGAQSISRNAATITGVVYPNNETTTAYFQYGLTSSYTAQTLPQAVSGSAPVSVSATLSGLQSGAVFHYRLVVQHQNLSTQTAGLDAVFQTTPSPRPRPRVSAGTTPRHGRLPATFQTTGRVGSPSWILAVDGCTGQVRITVSDGRRTVARTTTPVQPNCTFASDQVFRHLPGRGPRNRTVRLTVRVRFLGNLYLAPSSARNQTVTLRR